MPSMLFLVLLSLVAAAQVSPPTPAAAPSNFVGTWVGVQAWALDHPSPSAKEEQEVTLTIEEVNGKLVATLVPFFGGADGVTFVDAHIVGEELRATGRMGKARSDEPFPTSRNQARGWKDGVTVQLVLHQDRNTLKGTADVDMNGVKWLKYKYDLGRKRSRY